MCVSVREFFAPVCRAENSLRQTEHSMCQTQHPVCQTDHFVSRTEHSVCRTEHFVGRTKHSLVFRDFVGDQAWARALQPADLRLQEGVGEGS